MSQDIIVLAVNLIVFATIAVASYVANKNRQEA